MKPKLPFLLPIALVGAWLGASQAADVREGLVSYWPLDELSADWTSTPDVVSGNDMTAVNLTEFDIVPGKRGNAFTFTPDFMTVLYHATPPGEDTGLPVTESPTWTMMLWVNATYPVEGENDRRALSVSSSQSNNPLINIGTHNAGADNTVDIFVRNGATQVNHAHSTAPAYDGTWHHIALVDVGGQLDLYIDGNLDSSYPYTRGVAPSDITSIGAIVRGSDFSNVGAYFRGLIDEVAVWERALTQEEIQDVMNNGIQLPVPSFPPSITQQPVGATGLIVGDSWSFSVGATGSRPLSFQWKKDGVDIPGATGPTLTLTDLTEADSGTYTVVVSNPGGSVTSDGAVLEVGNWPAPDLERDLLAYWPLDELVGVKTPDVRSWYDMEAVNLTPDDVVPGKWGNCFQFDASRQTLLQRIHSPEDELPIYLHPEFSISLWVNGGIQQDLRVFSEASTETSRPLFNIGTHNAAADGTVDTYIRNDAGATDGGHQHTVAVAFDNTWHHIVYVQRTLAGQLTAKIYVDGVEDPNPPHPVPGLTPNTTTIGGIRRANPSHWFTGLIDDVALWTRALSPEEIQILYTSGMPEVTPRLRPLAINEFKASVPAVAKGGTVTLSWDVSTDADTVTIEPGVGDVTAQTVSGVGSVEVTVDQDTTFTITIVRGEESLSASTSVAAIEGIGSNWVLVDNFDQYQPEPLNDTGMWLDLRGGGSIVEKDGNLMLQVIGGDGAVLFPLGPLTLKEGEKHTLFFRVHTLDDPALPIRHLVGVTDKNIRWYSDANGNIGPHVIFDNNTVDNPGNLLLGTRNGLGGIEEFAPEVLSTGAVYMVWIDIDNQSVDLGDIFSVHIQKEGDPVRTTLFSNYTSDRDPAGAVDLGPTLPDLDKLFVAVAQENTSLLFDDFYLSKSGFDSSIPREAGFTGKPPTVQLGIQLQDGQVVLTWERGDLYSAPSVTGPWTLVEGAAPPSFTVSPSEQAAFYKVGP